MNDEQNNVPIQNATGADTPVSKAELQEQLSHYLLISKFEAKPLITQGKLDHELEQYLTKESFNSDKLHELEKKQEKNQKLIAWLIPAFVSVVGIIVSLGFN
ncbi:hypothetical protein [Weissella minor]|uniref:hypothetical protein n=1 Tax=Weissella minor TaxID=1620 RepID=UPI003AF2715F